VEARISTRLRGWFWHDIPELNADGLRKFGLMTGAVLAGLFGLFFPWLLEVGYPVWPWWGGGGLAFWALVAPGSLRPVYRAWMRIGLLLNRVTTPVIIGVIYCAVITPTALIMRALGRDVLARKFDGRATTYRIRSCAASKQTMERPF
jgi:hypothetical protein